MSDCAPLPVRTVLCPQCGGPSVYAPQNAYRPFCSQRCKMGDLGQWASEGFRLPAIDDQSIEENGLEFDIKKAS